MKKRNKFSIVLLLAFIGLSISGAFAETYYITAAPSSYTYYYVRVSNPTTGTLIASGYGIDLEYAIEKIRDHANGSACTINFGSGGTSVLDLDLKSSNATLITFENSGTKTWGKVTLTGSATSKCTSTNGIIRINNNISVESRANLTSTGKGVMIYNNSTGTLTVSSGTLTSVGEAITHNSSGTVAVNGNSKVITTSTEAGSAIYVPGSGTLNISGTAQVLASSGSGLAYGIFSNSTGKVNVSGSAQVEATNGRAIQNNAGGTVTISGGTVRTHASDRALVNYANGSITISGGTVRANLGRAVENNATGAVNISGGTVTSAGDAITNSGAGALNISGTAKVTTTAANTYSAIYNPSTGAVNISGGTVDGGSSLAIYNASTGKITVSGSGLVTSANGSLTQGTICLAGTASSSAARLEITGGTVRNTRSGSGTAVRNESPGAVNISGGTVSATIGHAVWNNSTGTIAISGGTVSASGSTSTVYNVSTGAINISGGAVKATDGNAVGNSGTGTITVSGTAQLSATATNPTVYNSSTGVINISGGTVSGISGSAVRNRSTGTVNISGGTMQATTGYAVWNETTGMVAISGGILFAYGTALANVVRGNYNYNNSTSAGIIVAWNQGAGKVNYVSGTSEHIFKFPDAATAVWAKQGTANGISLAYKTNSGFIPLGVTVADAPSLSGTVSITGTAAFGGTLTANTGGLTPTPLGTLSYQWKRGSTNIGSNSATYTLTQAEIGSTVTVTVTSANYSGSVTSAPTATITKATQTPPAAPTMASRISTEITLNAIAGCEYRRGTGAWQTSTTFSGLTPNTDYRFTARRAETATHSASSASPEATISTTTGVGIEELKIENGKLKIYPNPTSGELRVESGELQVEDYRIFNVAGQMLMQGKILEESPIINVTSLASGIYYLRAGDKTVKFVKK